MARPLTAEKTRGVHASAPLLLYSVPEFTEAFRYAAIRLAACGKDPYLAATPLPAAYWLLAIKQVLEQHVFVIADEVA